MVGTFSKGLKAFDKVVSMDEEKAATGKGGKRSRRQHRPPTDDSVGSTLLGGVVSLTSGLRDGVLGVVLNPIKGAQNQGFAGFLKGVGSGLVGVVVKPTVGLLDMTASALNAMSKIDHLGSTKRGLFRTREPRFFSPDDLLRRYNRREALGAVILFVLQLHEEDVEGETYVYHSRIERFEVSEPGDMAVDLLQQMWAGHDVTTRRRDTAKAKSRAASAEEAAAGKMMSVLVTDKAVRVLQGHTVKWVLWFPNQGGGHTGNKEMKLLRMFLGSDVLSPFNSNPAGHQASSSASARAAPATMMPRGPPLDICRRDSFMSIGLPAPRGSIVRRSTSRARRPPSPAKVSKSVVVQVPDDATASRLAVALTHAENGIECRALLSQMEQAAESEARRRRLHELKRVKLEEYMVARQQRKAAEALSTSHRARDVALTCVNSVRVQHCAEAPGSPGDFIFTVAVFRDDAPGVSVYKTYEDIASLFRDLPPEWMEQGHRPYVQPLVPITKGTLWKRKRNPRKPKFMNRLASSMMSVIEAVKLEIEDEEKAMAAGQEVPQARKHGSELTPRDKVALFFDVAPTQTTVRIAFERLKKVERARREQQLATLSGPSGQSSRERPPLHPPQPTPSAGTSSGT